MKKPSAFPQGTQRIARIGELCEPNTYVLEPASVAVDPPSADAIADGGVTDAELASAFVGREAPIAVRRTKRVTSAYNATVLDERAILTIA